MIKIIKSQQDKNQIIHESYIYEIKKVCISTINWRCIRKTCTATASSRIDFETFPNSFCVHRSHNQQADYDVVTKKIYIEKMKTMIEQPNFCPRGVVSTVMKGAELNLLNIIGPFDLLYRNLRNHRIKTVNPPPYAYPRIKLSSQLTKTHTRTDFYRYGIDNYQGMIENDNMLLFYSDFAIEKLFSNTIWAVDGTFSVVPSPYKQLFTISYIKEHHVFPCVFAILKNKTFDTYNFLFNKIKTLRSNVSPLIIKTDFERASIDALSVNFPAARISGCLFHLGQAVQRKVGELGLKREYRLSGRCRKFVRALVGLSFVRQTHLTSTYNLLISSTDFPESLRPLYAYFFSTYIDVSNSICYPSSVWHSLNLVNRNIPRTNNAIEGWHNTFANSFGSRKYSFPNLINKLQDEEDFIRIRALQQDELGHVFERKRKYVEHEILLLEYLNRYENTEFGLDFLMGLVEILHY